MFTRNHLQTLTIDGDIFFIFLNFLFYILSNSFSNVEQIYKLFTNENTNTTYTLSLKIVMTKFLNPIIMLVFIIEKK